MDRRALLTGLGAIAAAGPAHAATPLRLRGRFTRGGHVIGRTTPRAIVMVNGEALTAAGATGLFFIGLDRDAPPSLRIEVVGPDGSRASRQLTVTPRAFPSFAVNGLPADTVEPSDPALLARIRREVALKTEGFASRTDAEHFADGFAWPLTQFRRTGAWGSQRVLNGTPARPHYGCDMAAPAGAPILAPAPGVVTLAEPDLHFEGGLTLIDHGQGAITAYLHQSAIEVRPGQSVAKGQRIGRVGMRGRATGPHLCWRMKWRDRQVDPTLLVASD